MDLYKVCETIVHLSKYFSFRDSSVLPSYKDKNWCAHSISSKYIFDCIVTKIAQIA